MDPVEAARQAALNNARPSFIALTKPGPHRRELKTLIERCWAPNADQRPAFPEVCKILEKMIASMPRQEVIVSNNSAGDKGCCTIS